MMRVLGTMLISSETELDLNWDIYDENSGDYVDFIRD